MLQASNMSTWQYSDPLISSKVVCDECDGCLVSTNDSPGEVTIYTRQGTKFAQHFTKICPNRWCRKLFLCGYLTKNGVKVYDKLTPNTKYLISSNETAFATDFMYEATLQFLHMNATFHGISDVFNQFHNFENTNIDRVNLEPKRLATGFFLYGFLEMTSHCGIYPQFNTEVNWIDDAMLANQTNLKQMFSQVWCGSHKCDVENCEQMMISDGGQKIFRKVCAAKFSVVRKYLHSDKTVLTGCTAMPSPNSPFCSSHVNAETPVLLAEKITQKTRTTLQEFKTKGQSSHSKLPNDSVYTVETVLNARKVNGELEFLVKFAGFSKNQACWEPAKNLPSFIVNFFQEKANFDTPLPTPTIAKTVKLNNNTEIYHYLEWKPVVGEKLELKNGESLFDINEDVLSEEELKSSCNTRKVRDKRDRRHTAGILISAKPCGIIPHVDELFVSESINQVHGSIVEFLGNLDEETRTKIKVWLFDDMCHLKPHSENKKNANQNEVTKHFANMVKAVDRFHFPVHKKTDKYCQENCNPNKELKKLNIIKQNSPACEQAFKWLNEFKNMKTMNESRFKFFLLYMIDLHNLHIEKRVALVANPLNHKREEEIPSRDVVSRDAKVDKIDEGIDNLVGEIKAKLTLVEDQVDKTDSIEDCYSKDGTDLKCNFCPGVYKREGHLRNHLKTKHNRSFEMICKCGKPFVDSTRLNRHKKLCK